MTASLSRRAILQSAAVAAPALIVGFGLAGRLGAAAADAPLNAWLKISPDDTVTIQLSQSEMGQDVITTMPMLVAEELEADWSRIRVESLPSSTAPDYANPFFGAQVTAGSYSVVGFHLRLRTAGAQAREMLRQAAAERWKVPIEHCTARAGHIHLAGSNRKASYGQLAAAASRLSPPAKVALKDPKDWTILGKPTHRLDGARKVDGSAVYGIDVTRPGMLVGTVRACPVFGGKLKSLDDRPALAIPGVHSVLKLDSAFIVLADGYWPAHRGATALQPVWDDGPLGQMSSAQLSQALHSKLDLPGLPGVARGAAEVDAATPRMVEAVYEVPYLAHVTMEPMNGTASVTADGIEAWLPTQAAGWHQAALAATFGFKPDQVKIHTTFLGGGFGRRAEVDFALYPALASRATGRPVKVVWSREEDIQHDFYRPAAVGRLRAALDPAGVPTALDLKLVLQSISTRLAPPGAPPPAPPAPDPFVVIGLEDLAYGLEGWRASYVEHREGAPVGTWRAVPNTYNSFFIEGFIDEIAHRSSRDPLDLRRTLLAHSPRHLAVLEKAASAAGWGASPPGRFQGVALYTEAGSVVCEVMEISIGAQKQLRLHKVTAAIDCGRALNPTGVEAQVQGAILDGLGAALFGEITLAGGRVEQSNFDSYRMLRLADAPLVEVHIVESGAPLGGVGEPAVAPIAPALANAIFAATGERIRHLPIVRSGFTVGA